MSSVQNVSLIRNFGKTAQNNKPGWFDRGSGKQLESRPQGKEIFEIVIEDVKPGCWKNYVTHQGEIRSLLANKGISAEFVNTWKFVSGDVTSKSVKLIKYNEGWKDIDSNSNIIRSDPMLEEAYEYGNILIISQSTEMLKSYSFWPLLEASDKNENA